MINPLRYLTPYHPPFEFLQDSLRKSLASYRNALRPFRLSNVFATMNGLFDPLVVILAKLFIVSQTWVIALGLILAVAIASLRVWAGRGRTRRLAPVEAEA